MRVGDAIKLIETDGWRLVSIKGSHRQFKHPFKRGRVTIAGKLDMDLLLKTMKSILKAGRHRGGLGWPNTRACR